MEYVRALPDVERRIFEIKEEDICKTLLIDLFGQRVKKDKNGSVVGVLPPYCSVDEVITVEPGALVNVKTKIDTTIGRYIFNFYLISTVFGESIDYINKTLGKSGIGDLQQVIVNRLMERKIIPDQFAKFQNRLIWLNNFTELFVPGMSLRLLTPLPEIQKRKKELIEQYKAEIEAGDYVKVVAKIETELLELAKTTLKDDPSWAIYALGGKPSFGNNYKNTQIMMGPIQDPIEGKYVISTSSLSDGIPKEQYSLYANTLVVGSYKRGVSTQDGGSKTKYLFAAMQSEVLDVEGSDCKTTLTKKVSLTQSNHKGYLYRYIVEGDKLVLMTQENIINYIGKTVIMRTPMYCAGKQICSKCAGEMFYRIGIRNIGLTLTKISSTLLNLSLKSMHDTSVKTDTFDPFKYMKIIPDKKPVVS